MKKLQPVYVAKTFFGTLRANVFYQKSLPLPVPRYPAYFYYLTPQEITSFKGFFGSKGVFNQESALKIPAVAMFKHVLDLAKPGGILFSFTDPKDSFVFELIPQKRSAFKITIYGSTEKIPRHALGLVKAFIPDCFLWTKSALTVVAAPLVIGRLMRLAPQSRENYLEDEVVSRGHQKFSLPSVSLDVQGAQTSSGLHRSAGLGFVPEVSQEEQVQSAYNVQVSRGRRFQKSALYGKAFGGPETFMYASLRNLGDFLASLNEASGYSILYQNSYGILTYICESPLAARQISIFPLHLSTTNPATVGHAMAVDFLEGLSHQAICAGDINILVMHAQGLFSNVTFDGREKRFYQHLIDKRDLLASNGWKIWAYGNSWLGESIMLDPNTNSLLSFENCQNMKSGIISGLPHLIYLDFEMSIDNLAGELLYGIHCRNTPYFRDCCAVFTRTMLGFTC